METQSTYENADTNIGNDKAAILVIAVQKLISEKLLPILNGNKVPVPHIGFNGGTPGSVHENWYGRPDVYRGAVRRVAHLERAQDTDPYARMLYSDGGRRGDPWGACNIELNGHVYHFCAGLKRFPKLIEGNEAKPAALGILAAGIPGHMECDLTDWRWVQGEVDITPLITQQAINDLSDYFKNFVSDPKCVPVFQSRMHAETFGITLNPTSHNCTTIVTDALTKVGGINTTHHLPVDAYKDAIHQTSGMIVSKTPNLQSAVDYALNAMLCMDFIWVKRFSKSALRNAGIKPCQISEWAKSGKVCGTSVHSNDLNIELLLAEATKWLGAKRL